MRYKAVRVVVLSVHIDTLLRLTSWIASWAAATIPIISACISCIVVANRPKGIIIYKPPPLPVDSRFCQLLLFRPICIPGNWTLLVCKFLLLGILSLYLLFKIAAQDILFNAFHRIASDLISFSPLSLTILTACSSPSYSALWQPALHCRGSKRASRPTLNINLAVLVVLPSNSTLSYSSAVQLSTVLLFFSGRPKRFLMFRLSCHIEAIITWVKFSEKLHVTCKLETAVFVPLIASRNDYDGILWINWRTSLHIPVLWHY